jgi:hypothetical protein
MLTGRNLETHANFDKNYNLFINFQITKSRTELVKEVRQRKKDGTIKKYGVDQNGRVTIKVKIDSKFQEVTDAKSLAEVISNPVQAPAFRQRQNRDH